MTLDDGKHSNETDMPPTAEAGCSSLHTINRLPKYVYGRTDYTVAFAFCEAGVMVRKTDMPG